jgi:hypothetical protein
MAVEVNINVVTYAILDLFAVDSFNDFALFHLRVRPIRIA